jgi:uracil-DNA glycosylase family 4
MSQRVLRQRFVPDEGPADARILFVGEAPGEQEYEQLVGPLLVRLVIFSLNVLARNGLERNEVRLANLCHYSRPFNNKFEKLLELHQF